jgi:restriction system protein
VGAVRDFYGAMADRGANAKGFFITTNVFTLEAEKFAEGKPLELIDGVRLTQYIEMAKTGYVPVESPKLCPICKSSMVKRKGKFGEFYGCSRFPECKGTLKI